MSEAEAVDATRAARAHVAMRYIGEILKMEREREGTAPTNDSSTPKL
jgi:hypothetical protein